MICKFQEFYFIRIPKNEIDEYARLLNEASLPIELMVCRNAAEVDVKIADAEIIFGVHLPSESYARARKLRWIQSMWAGVEGLMNLPLAGEIVITKPWGVFARYLSHYVFGYLLADKIKLFNAKVLQEKCTWSPYRIGLLAGETMGIAGFGDVASEIAVVARAFGMKVWALNSDGRSHPLADKSFAPDTKDQFVSGVDVLVLALPNTPATRGMFDKQLLSKMKNSAWLVNVGRGALIEDDALIDLLENKRIAGAVLDVFRDEPLPAAHPYWRLPNCLVTPHIAGPSMPEDITSCFLENFKRYQSGEPMLGLVDRKRGY